MSLPPFDFLLCSPFDCCYDEVDFVSSIYRGFYFLFWAWHLYLSLDSTSYASTSSPSSFSSIISPFPGFRVALAYLHSPPSGKAVSLGTASTLSPSSMSSSFSCLLLKERFLALSGIRDSLFSRRVPAFSARASSLSAMALDLGSHLGATSDLVSASISCFSRAAGSVVYSSGPFSAATISSSSKSSACLRCSSPSSLFSLS